MSHKRTVIYAIKRSTFKPHLPNIVFLYEIMMENNLNQIPPTSAVFHCQMVEKSRTSQFGELGLQKKYTRF